MAAPDTFDPKHYEPFEIGLQAEKIISTFPAIDTVVDPIKITSGLENIAQVLDRGTLSNRRLSRRAIHKKKKTLLTYLSTGVRKNEAHYSAFRQRVETKSLDERTAINVHNIIRNQTSRNATRADAPTTIDA